MKNHRTRSETSNRVAKAIRLAEFLTDHLGAAQALSLVETASEAEWSRIAEWANERPPSTATRDAVAAVLRSRVSAPAVDVFAGLPS